jgi:RNA polymerase sigma-70 factor, ECF subfamily
MPPFRKPAARERLSSTSDAGVGASDAGARGERIEDLVRAHSPYVAGLAYRLLGRDADVDDVVQDVFVALLRFRTTIREVEAVRGWLATTTVRLARKRLRRRALREFLGFDDLDGLESSVRGATQEEHLALLRIHRALSGVPANARVVWLLRYVEQERMEEIARLAGCSLTTAKRRLETAQVAVKKALGHDS